MRKSVQLFFSKVAPYVFTAPCDYFYCFFLYPTISTIIMSFQRIVPGEAKFVGFENYRILFDKTFYKAVSNTVVFTFGLFLSW